MSSDSDSDSELRKARDEVAKIQEKAFTTAIDQCTDQIKLKSCVSDLRLTGLCAESWWRSRFLPELFVITVCYNDKTYDM